ncbi:hypothetical protein [Streptomyces sp. NPDC004629]|uniref:hypothetical protein n=1 Tax=Streptomyces sp. NPDC004629 TaxID=3364705 RepID=UPI0036BBDB30
MGKGGSARAPGYRGSRELGTLLFNPSTRQVSLAEAGRHLTEHARTLVAEEERARVHMTEPATGRAGRVAVGFIGTATYDVLPRVARTVRAPLTETECVGLVLACRAQGNSPATEQVASVIRQCVQD